MFYNKTQKEAKINVNRMNKVALPQKSKKSSEKTKKFQITPKIPFLLTEGL